MAKSPKTSVTVSHILSVPGCHDDPYTFKKFSELMPELKKTPWETIKKVAQFDLSVMEDRAREGNLLFILNSEDELKLPRGWLNIMVYDYGNTVVLMRFGELLLWNKALGFNYDKAMPFQHKRGHIVSGNTFAHVQFIAAPVAALVR